MFDVGFSELMLIGLVALVVIGPEKLPRVARTVGHLLGRVQRHVAEVKADISREIQLDEMKRLGSSIGDSARELQQSIQSQAEEISASLKPAADSVEELKASVAASAAAVSAALAAAPATEAPVVVPSVETPAPFVEPALARAELETSAAPVIASAPEVIAPAPVAKAQPEESAAPAPQLDLFGASEPSSRGTRHG